MQDHRLPRHDRPQETWLPHPGTSEPAPPQAPPLLGDDGTAAPVPARGPVSGQAPARPLVAPPGASLFVRFIFGLVSGRKSIPVAVAFSLLGPLGLFYVSFLNGVAGLIVVPYAARTLGLGLANAIGASHDTGVTMAVIVCWLITVPWSIIAARRRNAQRGL